MSTPTHPLPPPPLTPLPPPPPPPHTHTHTLWIFSFSIAVTLKIKSRSPKSNYLCYVPIIYPWKFVKDRTTGSKDILQTRMCDAGTNAGEISTKNNMSTSPMVGGHKIKYLQNIPRYWQLWHKIKQVMVLTFCEHGMKHKWNSSLCIPRRIYYHQVLCGRSHCQSNDHTASAILLMMSVLLWYNKINKLSHHENIPI